MVEEAGTPMTRAAEAQNRQPTNQAETINISPYSGFVAACPSGKWLDAGLAG